MTSKILVVCTGNVCRSPAVALLLDRRTDESVVVESAGTAALVGRTVSEPMAVLLQARGLSTDGFAARTATAELVAGADLVITMTRDQRSYVVRLEPRAVRHTFTLLELAALLDGAPVQADADESDSDRLARLPALAASRRTTVIGARRPLDVLDPYRRPERFYRRALAAIEPAVETIAHVVHPPTATLGSWTPPSVKSPRPSFPDAPGTPEGEPDDGEPRRNRAPRHGTRRRIL
jgi:protein-tyrosine phosphatase